MLKVVINQTMKSTQSAPVTLAGRSKLTSASDGSPALANAYRTVCPGYLHLVSFTEMGRAVNYH